ncbi:MAG: hypothetical protein R3E98_09905 [Gemmatimonadota bacterium]|nr:hypothetical protein [Gemmatimonadota bacterium]
MLELIGLGVAGVAGLTGHLKSKDFVRRRLRFTKVVETPGVGLFTGVATAVVAAPLVAALPFVGAGMGLIVGGAMGLGVGTGVQAAAREVAE